MADSQIQLSEALQSQNVDRDEIDVAVSDMSAFRSVAGMPIDPMTHQPQQSQVFQSTDNNGENTDYLHHLQGKYLELEINNEVVRAKIISTADKRQPSPTPPLIRTKSEKLRTKVDHLLPGSTNQWLYTNDVDKHDDDICLEQCSRCGNGLVNKIIAITVIIIQIASYIAITYFLIKKVWNEEEARAANCYGPNCDQETVPCMVLTTGAIISVLLIGFLWADVINVSGICHYNFVASAVCLIELC